MQILLNNDLIMITNQIDYYLNNSINDYYIFFKLVHFSSYFRQFFFFS